MEKTPEFAEKLSKRPKNYSAASERRLAYIILREQGMPIDKASKIIGISARHGRRIEQTDPDAKLKLSILSDKRITRAHKVIDRLMAGRTWGEIQTVRASDALSAASAVLDRAEPKTQDVMPQTLTFTTIDLSPYRCGSRPALEKAIEVGTSISSTDKVVTDKEPIR